MAPIKQLHPYRLWIVFRSGAGPYLYGSHNSLVMQIDVAHLHIETDDVAAAWIDNEKSGEVIWSHIWHDAPHKARNVACAAVDAGLYLEAAS